MKKKRFFYDIEFRKRIYRHTKLLLNNINLQQKTEKWRKNLTKCSNNIIIQLQMR